MKKYFLLITTLGFALTSNAYGETVFLKYEELPTLIQKNRKLAAKDELVKARESQTQHLKRSFLPEVNLSGGVENFHTGDRSVRTEPQFNIEAKLNLFNSGKDKIEDKIRNARRDIAQLNLKTEYLRQITEARSLYINSLFYQNQIYSLNKTLRDLNSLYAESKVKEDSGLIPHSEIKAITIFSRALRDEIKLLIEEKEHSLDELKVLLALPLSHKIKLKRISRSKTPKSIVSKEHPYIKSLEQKALISQNKAEKYKRWWAPSVDLSASYDLHTYRHREYLNIENRDEYALGLKVKMNLFDKLISSSKRKAEIYQAEAIKKEIEHLDQSLKAKIIKLKHGIHIRQELLGSNHSSLQLAQSRLVELKEEFKNGLKSSTDLISAYETILNKREKQNIYRRDYFQLKAKLSALSARN